MPPTSLPALEQHLEACLLELQKLELTRPNLPTATARAEAGERSDDLLDEIAEVQRLIDTSPAETLEDAAVNQNATEASLTEEMDSLWFPEQADASSAQFGGRLATFDPNRCAAYRPGSRDHHRVRFVRVFSQTLLGGRCLASSHGPIRAQLYFPARLCRSEKGRGSILRC